jgi:hypothetical protein
VTAYRSARERGIFSFVEILIATLILALAATATAYWVETVNGLGQDANEQAIGLSVVKVMEAVIGTLPFREPGGTTFGPEPGETLARFDDVDDFHGFRATPPIDGDRAPQPDLVDWTVEVTVQAVDPVTLAAVASSDLRRVRVRATRSSRPVADVWWLRARAPEE